MRFAVPKTQRHLGVCQGKAENQAHQCLRQAVNELRLPARRGQSPLLQFLFERCNSQRGWIDIVGCIVIERRLILSLSICVSVCRCGGAVYCCLGLVIVLTVCGRMVLRGSNED